MNRRRVVLLPLALLTLTTALVAAVPAASRFSDMRWRSIGPFRGGRTVAAAGVPGQPNVFYIGVNNGGVWKTNDFGRTWHPDLRPRADRLDRRDRRRALQPQRHLRRQRRRPPPPRPLHRRRHLQVHRRRAVPGPTSASATDSRSRRIAVDPHSPDRLFVAVARTPLRTQRGARHLPLDRRRPHLSESPLPRPDTPAAWTSPSIPPTPRSSTPSSGRRPTVRGKTPTSTDREAGSSNPPTAARPGRG